VDDNLTDNQLPIPTNTEDDRIPDPIEKYNHKLDISKAITLRLKNGLTYKEIGDILGCSKQAVWERLKNFTKLLEDPASISAYEDNKSKLFSAAELKLLTEILDPAKLEKASINNVAYAFSQVAREGHLARGEATSNVNSHLLIETLTEIDQEMARLEAELEG